MGRTISDATLIQLFFLVLATLALAVPHPPPYAGPQSHDIQRRDSSNYWFANIQHTGSVPYGDPNYKIWRNVKDFGAIGDGTTDDTVAINKAMTEGNRCGANCDSQTTTPAILYFPPGTCRISSPIIMYYYTQIIGDATNSPVIKGLPSFQGLALIDTDPYIPGGNGAQWYANQNNFFRQIRNIVIDLTDMPESDGYGGNMNGIHWQVAQASSMQNVVFNMRPASPTNKQRGIMAENGSGMFFSDLIFNGGGVGAFIGGQQYTTRNLTFRGCNTAIQMIWNWLWTFKSVTIINCEIGLDISALDQTGVNQTVGSAILMDSTVSTSKAGILTSYNATSSPKTGGTLLIHNVDFTNSANAVMAANGNVILKGGAKIAQWGQGNAYMPPAGTKPQKRYAQPPPAPDTYPTSSSTPSGTWSSWPTPGRTVGTGQVGRSTVTVTTTLPCSSSTSASTATVSPLPSGNNSTTTSSRVTAASKCSMSQTLATPTQIVQRLMNGPAMSSSLLAADGSVFQRGKPQYLDVPLSQFVSIMKFGVKGDGVTDDTEAFQKALDGVTPDQILYVDHGAYVITRTIVVPKNIRITGEFWPMIMISGEFFGDSNNPKPAIVVGNPGDTGNVEITDLMFETRGPAPGAIMMEWNVQAQSQGSSGMWDSHFRVGGTAGTELQAKNCIRQQAGAPGSFNPQCAGAFLMLHIKQTASGYFENDWMWVADHDLDAKPYNQTNIFSGRGVLIESQGPVWMWGTSSEHSQLYNYQIANAKDVFMGSIQTETAYMQSAPNAMDGGFTPMAAYSDPDFSDCTDDSCKKTWGLRIVDSTDIFMFGGGLYSFFDKYLQECLKTESCQLNMVDIVCSTSVYLYGLVTKAATNQIVVDGKPAVLQKDNTNMFGSTVLLYEQQ